MLTDKLGFSWISSSFRRDRVARATYWPGSAATGYAKLGEEVPRLNGLVGRSHQILQFFPELPQLFQTLGSGFDHFCLSLKHLAAADLGEHTHDFPDLPAGCTQHLQAVGAGHKQRNAVIAHDTYTFWKAIKGLKFEPCHVDLLELVGSVRHVNPTGDMSGELDELFTSI